MNSPLVSIIIPVYNAEEYLKECLDSVFHQTYSRLEVIAVNDGSTDRSGSILSSFIDETRLKVVQTANYGVSHARNVGLDNITGEYVTFLDSDDTIDLDFVELLLKEIEKTDADIAICSYKKILGSEKEYIGNSEKEYVMTPDEAIENLLSGRLFMGGLCGKLYNTSLIGEERLDESFQINEDVLMNFALFCHSQKVVHIDVCKYNYREHESSATHQIDLMEMREQEFRASEIIMLQSQNKSYHPKAYGKYAVTMLNWYQSFIMMGSKKTNEAEVVKNRMKKEQICSHLFRRNERIRYLLFVYTPELARIIYRIHEKTRTTQHLDPIQGE